MIPSNAILKAVLLLGLVGSSVASEKHNLVEIESDLFTEDELFFGRELQAMSVPPPEDICIDFALTFENYPTLDPDGNIVPGRAVNNGDYISDQYFRAFGIMFESTGGLEAFPRVFDSANPNPLDLDLGTPHVAYGGPGRGAGGRPGTPGQNDVPRGNVLIVQENDPNETNNDFSIPNDKRGGGTIMVIFTRPVRLLETIGLLDIADDRGETRIEVTYATSADEDAPKLLQTFDLDGNGNNGQVIQEIDLPYVSRLNVVFGTSGAITFVNFCADEVRVAFGEGEGEVGNEIPGVKPFRKLEKDDADEATADTIVSETKDRKLEKRRPSSKAIPAAKTTKGRKLHLEAIEQRKKNSTANTKRENKKPPSRNYTRGGGKQHKK